MSWAEIKKMVNSDLTVPLNEQIMGMLFPGPSISGCVDPSNYSASYSYAGRCLLKNLIMIGNYVWNTNTSGAAKCDTKFNIMLDGQTVCNFIYGRTTGDTSYYNGSVVAGIAGSYYDEGIQTSGYGARILGANKPPRLGSDKRKTTNLYATFTKDFVTTGERVASYNYGSTVDGYGIYVDGGLLLENGFSAQISAVNTSGAYSSTANNNRLYVEYIPL